MGYDFEDALFGTTSQFMLDGLKELYEEKVFTGQMSSEDAVQGYHRTKCETMDLIY